MLVSRYACGLRDSQAATRSERQHLMTPTLQLARDLFERLKMGYIRHLDECTCLHGSFDCSCGLVEILTAMKVFES